MTHSSSEPKRRQWRGGVRGGVEADGTGRCPVAGVAAPALGGTVASALVNLVAASQQVNLAAEVPVVGSNEADGAVAVLGVVPADERGHLGAWSSREEKGVSVHRIRPRCSLNIGREWEKGRQWQPASMCVEEVREVLQHVALL